MRSCRLEVFHYCVLACVALGAAAEGADELLQVRQDAYAVIRQGDRVGAAASLLETLRAIPAGDARYVEPAVGIMQLLLFTNEYLMLEPEREVFQLSMLDEESGPLDRLTATLMRYGDDAGITQEEADRCAYDISELTRSDHQPAKLAALFVMSSPYYYHDTHLGRQARTAIVKQFPDSFMAQEAQRLILYYTARERGRGLLDAFFRKEDDGTIRAESLRLREDPVGRLLYSALTSAPEDALDQAAVDALLGLLRTLDEPALRFSVLNLLAHFEDTTHRSEIFDAVTLAAQEETAPEVAFRARTLKVTLCDAQRADGLAVDVHALLALDTIPTVTSRNNYEELANAVQLAAKKLSEVGRMAEARTALSGLCNAFPASLLAQRTQALAAALDRQAPPAR